MKKLIGLAIFLLITIQFSVAQSANVDFSQKPPNLDSLLPKIKAEKSLDSVKIKAKAKLDSMKSKSATKMEETAKKLKESLGK